ncbi:hypothetical protein LSAT2_019947 [Lamellibrachia satsuma]|nr:hypothetical protein LSAT2_019947 [Lamellibrachia satsuma]
MLHVNMVCRSIYYHLRSIGKIMKHLDVSTAQIATRALITSKLDYLNGLLHGLPACQLAKQACRILLPSRVPRRCHITPVFRTLHWLPIKYRVQVKSVFALLRIGSGCITTASRKSRVATAAVVSPPVTRLSAD